MATTKQTNPGRRGNAKRSVKRKTKQNSNGERCQLSLLEKAEQYKVQNPEKWEARQQERRCAHMKMVGKYEIDPFLEGYNGQIKLQSQEKIRKLKEKENAPRTVSVELKFVTNDQPRVRKGRRPTFGNITENPGDRLSVYYNSDKQSADANQSELTVTILKGENLFNHLRENDCMCKKCSVSLALCPDSENHKMRSSSRYITPQGFTKWEHNFVFRGFSVDDLKNKYLKISLSGQSTSGRVLIGQAVLAGQKALINTPGSKPRQPTTSEVLPLEKTLNNPDTCVPAILDLCLEGRQEMAASPTHVEKQMMCPPNASHHEGERTCGKLNSICESDESLKATLPSDSSLTRKRFASRSS